jgi:hypothetical protein
LAHCLASRATFFTGILDHNLSGLRGEHGRACAAASADTIARRRLPHHDCFLLQYKRRESKGKTNHGENFYIAIRTLYNLQ